MVTIVAHGKVFHGTLREIEDQLDQHENERLAELRQRAKTRRQQKRGPLNLWTILRRLLGW